MKSNDILYSDGNNDECYTPAYAVYPILRYIPRDAIVWCPFDTLQSEYVRLISKKNPVTYSHIASGEDFYTYEPEQWDVLISNPPFTDKRFIFQRALSFNKPFALLMSNTWLNDSAPKQLFKQRDLQLLMFEQRVHFTGRKDTTFSSSYYCWNFLPKQIIMGSFK